MALKDPRASVLARLKNRFRKEGGQYQYLLQLFLQEEFIRRLSRSPHKDRFILKGGMMLYVLTDFKGRATRDMDFDLLCQSNQHDRIRQFITEICQVRTENDFVSLTFNSASQILIKREFAGSRVNILGQIGKVRIPFSIDIGYVGDVFPAPVPLEVRPQLPGFTSSRILAFQLETVIAEKLHAIVSQLKTFSRMKDFYDIYFLAGNFVFGGVLLAETIRLTFAERNCLLTKDVFDRIDALAYEERITTMWDAYLPALRGGLDLKEVLSGIRLFLSPVIDALLVGRVFDCRWDPLKKRWDPTVEQ